MANGTLAASQIEMLTQSGTGIVTIVPPATNTNRTLTLPDSTGTLLNTNGGTITGTLTVTGVTTLGNGAVLGVPASGTVTNLTGTASININGTVGATTATTGAFTTLSATGTGAFLVGSGATTAARYAQIVNNGSVNGVIFGTEGTTAGGILTGTSSYSGIISQTGNLDLALGTFGVARLIITGAGAASFSNGLAVTGTLSATGAMTTTSQNGFILDYNSANRIKSFTASQSSPKDYLTILSAGSTGSWQGATRFGVSYNGGTVIYPLELIANTDGTTAAVAVTGTLSSTGILAVAAAAVSTIGGFSTADSPTSMNLRLNRGATQFNGIAFAGAVTYDRGIYLRPSSDTLHIGRSAGSVFSDQLSVDSSGNVAVFGTLSGGTSGTGYSFSGSAPATSLTLDASGNLGIGTAPAYKLHVVKGSAGITARFTDGDGITDVYGYGLEITRSIAYIKGSSALHLGSAAGYSAVVLDSAGNLGLGVTPSAWSGIKVLQVGSYGGFYNLSTAVGVSNNWYYDGTNARYINTSAASYYAQSGNVHGWHQAASGTAGASAAVTSGQSYTVSVLGSSTLAQWQAFFSALTVLPTVGQVITATATGSIVGGGTVTQNITFTQAMTLDSNKNLLVGATSNSTYPSRGYFIGNATYGGLSVSAPGDGSGYPVYFVDSNATSASQQLVHFERGATYVGSINTTDTATSYSTSSDYRLKNTIAPITGALAKVALLKPCTYKWNIDGSEGQGFIAHELQEVCPIAVHGTKDAIDADGKPDYQGVDTSFLVATLTAAIQEQQAIIESLKARLDAANL